MHDDTHPGVGAPAPTAVTDASRRPFELPGSPRLPLVTPDQAERDETARRGPRERGGGGYDGGVWCSRRAAWASRSASRRRRSV